MMPKKQGDLDNFCGIYSIVNAVSHLYPHALKPKPLYLRLVNQFNQYYDIMDLINQGMSSIEMDYLIENVLQQGYYKKHYPINIQKPYQDYPKLTTPQLFAQIKLFLNKNTHNRAVVIFATQYHWSVIKAVNNQFIDLFDSCSWQKAYRRCFSIHNHKKRYKINLSDIYFLECENRDHSH